MLNRNLSDRTPPPARARRARLTACSQHGFTLIELMIVIVVISILAGIAYPSYTQYVQRTRRSEAQIALTQMAAAQEKYFTVCSTYSLNLEQPNLQPTSANCATSATDSTEMSEDDNYTLSAVAGPGGLASGFILTATASTTGKQRGDSKCVTLTLSSTGAKDSTDDGGASTKAECWKK